MSAEFNNKLFIQALEQRIMLDGAAADSILDAVETTHIQTLDKRTQINAENIEETNLVTSDPAVSPLESLKAKSSKKNIVFIDSQVTDYNQIINAFKKGTEVYVIDANENGFERMADILDDRSDIDAIHIIGHGSAGEIVFGNAYLNNDTIETQKSTLETIGQALTQAGDILFYACNVAATQAGDLLLSKISEYTKADIAASDDITGKGGDWDLEKMEGFVDVKKLRVEHYDHSLGSLTTTGVIANSGVTHIDTNVEMIDSGNVGLGSTGATSQLSTNHFGLVVEKKNVSVSSGDLISDVDVDQQYTLNDNDNGGDGSNAIIAGGSDQNASTSMTVNSYLLLAVFNDNRRSINNAAEVVFDGEIVGVLFDQAHTRAEDIDGNTFHSSSLVYAFQSSPVVGGSSNSDDTDGGRIIEGRASSGSEWRNFFNTAITSIGSAKRADSGVDWVAVGDYGSGTNNYLKFGSRNAANNTGDYIRILVKQQVNTAPSATADTGYIQEGKTLTVTDGLAAEDGTDSNTDNESGDHTGDILGNDTDADSDSLTVTSYSHTSSTGQGGADTTPGSPDSGTAGTDSVAGTYGTLDLEADGSYTYTANSDITNLDVDSETFEDVFTYTVSDGTDTDTATITITIEASGDVTAQDDTGSVNEDATLTVDNSDNANSVAAASYSDSDSFTIAGSDSSPATTQNVFEDMIFNDDGTKMYVLGYESGVSGGSLFQYTLSTPFDVSTASVSSDDYINVGSRTDNNEAIRFNNDGTKLFVLADSTGQNITSIMHQYTLTTPYDITSTVTEGTRKTLGTSSTDNFRAFLFNDDGSKMFVSKEQYIYEYTLSTPFDTSTASSPDTSFYVTNSSYGISNFGSSSRITGMQYNSDGTKLFTVHQMSSTNHTAKIVEWSLSTAYDPTTASTNADFNDTSTYFETGETTTASASPTDFITFNNDGSKFFSFNGSFSGLQKIKEWNVSSPFSMLSTSGSHSGDTIDTSSASNSDSDADGDTLTITAIRTGSTEGSGTAGIVGGTTDGTYGTLTMNSDGSYTYVADKAAADPLDPGDVVTDAFNYTVSDGNGEDDIAVLTITVVGINDDPVADDETNSVTASTTTTVNDGTSDVLYGDTDADDSASLSVTNIVATTASGSDQSVAANSTNSSNFTTATGSFGTLRIGADGTYVYIAGSSNGTDVFTYTLSDGTATDTATLTFTVTGANAAPSATADTGYIAEDSTLTVSDGAAAEDGTDSNTNNESGDHTGDVLGNDSDSDGDSLTITSITATTAGGSAQTTFTSNTETVTGSYGTLTINSNGSYSYAATADAADALDVGDTITDVFTYIVSDGTDTDTSTLTITIAGINDAPVAQDDVGVIVEGGTLTVANSANANVSGSYDATGEHSGDVIDTSSASHTDSDADASASLTITEIRTGATENAGTSGTVGAALTGTYGQLTIASDGSYSYVANQAAADALDDTESAVDSFNYTLSDGTDTDFGVIRITVLGSNDAPTAVNDDDTATEGSVTTVTGSEDDVLNDDSDVDVETITVTNISHTNGNSGNVTASTTYADGETIVGTYGTLVIGADGSYEFTPNDVLGASETGNDVFTYTVSDGTDTSTATLTITTTGANDAPVADNETGAVNEDATLTVSDGTSDLLHGDTDADSSDTLTITTYSHTSATDEDGGSASTGNGNSGTAGSDSVVGYYGTLTLAADGTYTYAADQDVADALDDTVDTVTDVFTYTVSDGNGGTDTATLTITITGVNDDPVGVADTDSVQVSTTVTDTTNSAGTVISDDTDADDSSSLTVTAIQHSGDGSSTSVTDGTTRANGETSTGDYGTLTIGSDGSYSYVAGSSTGTDVFTYTVSDGTATATTTLTITVNNGNPPVGVNDTDDVNEDATVTKTGSQDDVLNDDTDVDGNVLSVTLIGVGSNSDQAVSTGSTYNSSGQTVTGTYGQLTIGADGSYTYNANQSAADTLDDGDTVTDTFTYTVSDGINTDTATLIFNVTGVNDDPVATADSGSVNEDATLTVSTASSGVVQDNDTDPDGDDTAASLVVNAIEPFGGSSSSVTAGTTYANGTSVVGTYGTLTIGADGTYSYTADQAAADALDAGDTDTDVFTYLVVDSSGAFDTANITITVTGVNDTPVAADDTGAVNEDATLTVSSAASGVVQDNDTDPDTDDTAASLEVSQIAVSGGSNSAVNSGSTYNSGTPTTVTGTYGQLTIGADGTYTYVANQSAADDLDAGDTATDTFTYTVTDTTGATSTADIEITVTGVNDVPTAADNTVTTTEDTPYVFSTSDFGYTDADDDDALVSVTITTLEDDGALQYYDGSTWQDVTLNQVITATDIANGYLRLNPDANETGSPYTTFAFTVNDGDADSATPNTMTINVTAENDAPVGVPDTDSVNEDSSVTKTGAQDDVLNDDTDADSDSLTITFIGTGSNSDTTVAASSTYNSNGTTVTGTYGQLTIGANGSYKYEANQSAADDLDLNDTATDTFTYTVSDGNGGTDTTTLTFTVTGVNDDPTGSDKTVTTAEDTPYVFSTSDFGYTDADDDDTLDEIKITTLETTGALQYYNGTSWTDVTINQEISATDIADGYLRFNPDADDSGSPYTTFGFKVSDGSDNFSSSANTITINVTAVNDDPVAIADTSTVTEDDLVRVRPNQDDVLNDDTDPESDSLTVTAVRPNGGSNSTVSAGTSFNSGTTVTGTYGQLTIGANGSYVYRANQDEADTIDVGESKTDVFVYTVSDGNGGSDTATLTFTINGVEDDPTATKDEISLNLDQSSTSSGSLISNDTDPDDSLTITGCGNGRNPSNGTPQTVGTAFNGTYGQMKINSDGSYTFTAFSNINDLLEPGQSVIERFYYTISDGNSTDTAVIEISVQRGNVVVPLSRPEFKIIKKQIIKEVEVDSENVIDLDRNNFENGSQKMQLETVVNNAELPKTEKVLKINEGLKLVDLVAESGSVQLTENRPDSIANINNEGGSSESLVNLENLINQGGNKLKAKVNPEDSLRLKFGVFNESESEVIRYEGQMPDGTKLPDWIKVNPKNGKVTTTVPKDVDNVEFVVIAIDTNNDKREIKVKIDPKQLAEDKGLFKKAKREQKSNTNIVVNEQGQANLIQRNEQQEVNQVATDILNSNTSDIALSQLNIKDLIQSIKPVDIFNSTEIAKAGKIEFALPAEFLGSFNDVKIVMQDGSDLPAWVKFDVDTGTLIALPPDGREELKLKMIINENGEIKVKDLEIKIVSETNKINKDVSLPEDPRFTSFQDQIAMQNSEWDDYGENLIKRL